MPPDSPFSRLLRQWHDLCLTARNMNCVDSDHCEDLFSLALGCDTSRRQ